MRQIPSGTTAFRHYFRPQPVGPNLHGGSHRLDEITNPRLQRLRLKLSAYNYTVSWTPGKRHHAADALSRAPVLKPTEEDVAFTNMLDTDIAAILAVSANSDLRLDELRRATDGDDELRILSLTIRNGWPSAKNQSPLVTRQYWGIRSMLTVRDGIVLYGCRSVIPKSMRKDMLSKLHEGHQGIDKTKLRARQSVYWPEIDADIERVTKSCKPCNDTLPSQLKEPLTPHHIPDTPWVKVGTDIFSYGTENYIIIVDYTSFWPEVHQLSAPNTACVIDALSDAFSRLVAALRPVLSEPQHPTHHLQSALPTIER